MALSKAKHRDFHTTANKTAGKLSTARKVLVEYSFVPQKGTQAVRLAAGASGQRASAGLPRCLAAQQGTVHTGAAKEAGQGP